MKRITTIPMDAEWKERLSSSVINFIVGLSNKSKPKYMSLRDKLLSIGGEEVCLCYESDLDEIFERGQFFKGKSKMIKGRPCRCHTNVGYLFDEHPNVFRVATGWALSEDGVWRQHSWAINITNNTLIETTVKRKAYYGFILNEKECCEWVENNC